MPHPVTASSLDLRHPARPGLHRHIPGVVCAVLEWMEIVTKAVRVCVSVSVGGRGHACPYSWRASLGEGPEPCPPRSLPVWEDPHPLWVMLPPQQPGPRVGICRVSGTLSEDGRSVSSPPRLGMRSPSPPVHMCVHGPHPAQLFVHHQIRSSP